MYLNILKYCSSLVDGQYDVFHVVPVTALVNTEGVWRP